MRLLDTDIIIDVQRGHPPAIAWFKTLTERPAVPGLVVMELIQDAQSRQQLEKVLKIVNLLTIVYATEADQQRALSDYIRFISHMVWDCWMRLSLLWLSGWVHRFALSTSNILE